MQTCQYCGTANRADAAYCNHCGGALGATGSAQTTPGASATQAASPIAAPPGNATGRLPPNFLIAGCYLIEKNVGQGGMAAVYRARDTRNNSVVAIKEMSQDGLAPDELKEALDSFRSEADMLMRLRHPNLPRVYGRFSSGARHYLVMEYIEGRTLEQKQQSAGGGALPEADVLGWARQICNVLSYLHQQTPPIIFRDLKPANVMLTNSGQIKLIDFGIARVFAPGRVRDTQVLGTPGFAPPEQYGKTQTDARADQYALACTLYQLLTGYDPAITPFALPPMRSRNPQTTPRVQSAIERATKLNRDERYPTIDDFARELLPPPTGPRPAPKMTLPHPAVSVNGQTSARPAVNPQPRAGNAAAHAAPTMAAAITVNPPQLDFGTLPQGQRGTLSMTVGGLGNARVRGQITSLAPWVRVDKTAFDGVSTLVQVSAETSKIATTGPQLSSLQITCDRQQLFMPIKVQVAPARGTSRGTGTGSQTGAKNAPPPPPNRHVPPKLTTPGPRTTRTMRFLTGVALAFALSAFGLTEGQKALHAFFPALALTAPVALALLLLVGALGAFGAVAGSGVGQYAARLRTALFGAGVGLVIWLALDGRWLVAGGRSALLTQPIALPHSALLLAPLVVSAGSALGADDRHSRWMHTLAAFSMRHLRPLITLASVVAGGYLGYLLTSGVLCLTPIGIIAGMLLGLAVVGPMNRLPRRRSPPRPRYASRYPGSRWP